ncbi:MAG: LuxR C-terminal-related transcriptional regulator [Chloroflexota bacterium]
MRKRITENGQPTPITEKLTPREQDVLALMAEGLSNREIAAILTIQPASVKWYTKQIYGKLGVHNRQLAAAWARRFGMVGADDHDPEQASCPPDNLPAALSSFIGREQEIARVSEMLANPSCRLVTLTGAGGVGKTRLALRVAQAKSAHIASQVWLVELASISREAMVVEAVNASFGLPIDKDRSPASVLQDHLRPKDVLLVLDNCEHVIAACASLIESLLKACPKLRILATSRELLGVSGEIAYCVPSLSVPETDACEDLARLAGYEAVLLFVARARQALASFQLTSGNVRAIIRICRRLDGIPLAIELAAAQVAVLGVAQLAARLDEDLAILAHGGRMALARHQTIQASIRWSYGLLAENERLLLSRLSVFAGGWTLPAAEQVCSDELLPPAEVFPTLVKLIQKSLVQVKHLSEQEARYQMLEMVRQFVEMERCLNGQEEEALRNRHNMWCLCFAEMASQKLSGGERLAWQKKIDADYDNLRAALTSCLADGLQPETGSRIAIALGSYWEWNSHRIEGCRWVKAGLDALAQPDAAECPTGCSLLKSRLWRILAVLDVTADPLTRITWLENACNECRASGCAGDLDAALALAVHGVIEAFDLGNLQRGLALLEQSDALLRARPEDVKGYLASVLSSKGAVLAMRNRHAEALDCVHESAVLCRAKGDVWMTMEQTMFGDRALRRGAYALARRHYEEALSVSLEAGNRVEIAGHYKKLGDLERTLGHHAQAFQFYDKTLEFYVETGWLSRPRAFAWLLEGLALNEIAWGGDPDSPAAQAHDLRAACILGVERALLEKVSLPMFIEWRAEYERAVATLRARLDPVMLETVQAEGRAMSIDDAVRLIRCPQSGDEFVHLSGVSGRPGGVGG